MEAVLVTTERSAWRCGVAVPSDFGCLSAPGTPCPRWLGGRVPARRDGWIRARSERAQSSAAPSGAAGSCRIDTPGRMLCLFAQQSCLMLLAYQGDQHGSDNTCLTPPAFSHRRVDLLSRLLFSGRQFLALSVNGVNNSHQYLI